MPQPGHFGQSQNALSNMEFTWVKTCAARKYTFLRAHFWSPGTAYLKCTCPNVYFWCFGDVYFLDIFGAFPMHFLSKSVFFFYAFGTCVSTRCIFFYALGTSVLCRCIFFTPVWKSDLHVYCGCIFLPARCAFFLQAHFWTAAVETKPAFLLHVYFGSICFPKIKRTFICFKIVRVSTRFGELNARHHSIVHGQVGNGHQLSRLGARHN